jgi:hypothetical protein
MSRLVIDRLNAECLVSHQHPQPERVRFLLDGALGGLQAALASAVARILPIQSNGVWCIRRLDLDLALDVGRFEAHQLDELLGQRLAAYIATILRQPPDGQNVLFFADRAHYVAQFVVDCAAGRAWQRWYYRAFQGLAALSTSQAIRQAIVRETDDGIIPAIVGCLQAGGNTETVLRVLTETDTQAIYAAAQRASGDTAAGPVSQGNVLQLVRLWTQANVQPREGYASAKNRWRIWAAWRGHQPAPPPPAQEAAWHALLGQWLPFLDLVAGAADTDALLADAAEGRFTEIVRQARQPAYALEYLLSIQAVAAGNPRWLRQVISALAPLHRPEAVSTPGAAPTLATLCSGLFLLLPTIAALHLPELLDRHAPSADTAQIWRMWLALKCLGGSRLALHRADPALVVGLGLDSPREADVWSAAVAATTPALCSALAEGLLHLLQSQERIRGEYVAVSAVPGQETDRGLPDEPLHVIHDMQAGYWLAVTTEPSAHALERLAAVLAHDPVCVWPVDEAPPPDYPTARAFAHQHQPAAAALAYYGLPDLPPHIDHTFSLLADAVMRTFARRLMGFAWSSPAHLYQNFLVGTGQLHVTPTAIHVSLPQPPLFSVTMMAGMHRDEYRLPWATAERVVRILPP